MSAGHRYLRDRIRRRRLPRPRVFQDRENPLETLTEDEVFARFRFRPVTIIYLVGLVDGVARKTLRSCAVPILLAVLAYLRYLATGGFQLTVGDTVKLRQPTVSRLCRQVGKAMLALGSQFTQLPNDTQLLKQQFVKLAGFPNVTGCIDCTHVWIKKPSKNPEDYIGRKGIPTINVQAVCDANFEIMSVVVKWPGRTHDARIWRNSTIKQKYEDGRMDGFLLGDSGYPLSRHLLTPYLNPTTSAESRFNGSLCRTRVTIEQTFGILKQRFQVLRRKMNVQPDIACMHIKNCVTLHNLGIRRKDILCNVDTYEGDNEQERDFNVQDRGGKALREYITQSYFM